MSASGVYLQVRMTNFYKVRDAVVRLSGKDYTRGLIKEFSEETLKKLRDYAAAITHRWTGLLSQSHMWEYDSHTMIGTLYIDPRAIRKQGQSSLAWPKVYGVYEHDRGGDHAFYERTWNEAAPFIAGDGVSMMIRSLAWQI